MGCVALHDTAHSFTTNHIIYNNELDELDELLFRAMITRIARMILSNIEIHEIH